MHCAFRTSHRPLARTGRPSAHASSATIDRLSKYDGMISSSAAAIASNLSASSRNPRCRIRGCVGNRQQRVADEHERQRAPRRPAGSSRRTGTAPRSPCSRRSARRRSRMGPGCCTSGGSDAAAGSPAHPNRRPPLRPARPGLPETASIIARSSGELYISPRTPRKIGRNTVRPIASIALGRRHQHGAIAGRASAVVRVDSSGS